MTDSASSRTNPPNGKVQPPSLGKRAKRLVRTVAVYSLLALLLYFALRNAPLSEIWATLNKLRPWQLLTLSGINAVIYVLISLRWWLVLRAENKKIQFFPLLAIRVAVFGISYFTLGPQVGGEPLQVLYLQRKYGMTYTRATSTVIMDKLLEFLANFIFLGVGLTAFVQAGFFSTSGNRPLMSAIGLIILMAWPPIHIILLYHGRYPISALLRKFAKNRSVRFIGAAERMAGTFCRRHLSSLISAILVSVLGAAGMLVEFFYITSFLEIDLYFWQAIAAWTAGWLAFLVPLPGGLGALEASQVFALGAFGISAASAISVALLIRARDLLIGGLGLILAGRGAGK